MSRRIVRSTTPKGVPVYETDSWIQSRLDLQSTLDYAFKAVRPTAELIRKCHEALAQAGVKPLPVPNVLDA